MKFNYSAFKAIYLHEMDRFKRTLMQSLLSPVLSTSLYFIVFGSVIGGYVEKIDGISYGSYIVPGLLMLKSKIHSSSKKSLLSKNNWIPKTKNSKKVFGVEK